MSNWVKTAVRKLVQPCFAHKWVMLFCLVATAFYAVQSQTLLQTRSFTPGYWSYDHGWPLRYLVRTGSPEVWGGRWRIFLGVEHFEIWPLLWNLFVAFGLSFMTTHLWYRHCLNAKPWQFSLKEMLVAMTILGVSFGAYAKYIRDHNAEQKYINIELKDHGWEFWPANIESIPWYLQPLQEAGVFDENYWLYFKLEWDTEWHTISYENMPPYKGPGINDVLAEQVAKGVQLKFLRTVSITDTALDDRGIQQLCQWAPNCTSLEIRLCQGVTDDSTLILADKMKCLVSLRIEETGIADDGIRQITKMSHLETLYISDFNKKTTGKGLIEYFRKMPKLKELNYPEHWEITDDDVEYFEKCGVILNEAL